MRKLIEKRQESSVICDNKECDFKVPYTDDDNLLKYINVPCPKCGQNLLTVEDYIVHEKMIRSINFINRWFSWLTIFMSKKSIDNRNDNSVHYHDGKTTIQKVERSNCDS